MALPVELQDVIVSDPEIVSGTPCFRGTRVPLATFLDCVEEGYSLERFLRGYPSVSEPQARAALHWLAQQTRRAAGIELL